MIDDADEADCISGKPALACAKQVKS